MKAFHLLKSMKLFVGLDYPSLETDHVSFTPELHRCSFASSEIPPSVTVSLSASYLLACMASITVEDRLDLKHFGQPPAFNVFL